jgi:hypothetical protein
MITGIFHQVYKIQVSRVKQAAHHQPVGAPATAPYYAVPGVTVLSYTQAGILTTELPTKN